MRIDIIYNKPLAFSIKRKEWVTWQIQQLRLILTPMSIS